MRSVMERRLINGRKFSTTEREAQELSVAFLKRKYETARRFFSIIRRLKLAARETPWMEPFGMAYYADKLTQRITFGKYNASYPERGSRVADPNSVVAVPAWFSKPVRVDDD